MTLTSSPYTNTAPSTQYLVIHSDPRPECGTCETTLLLELEPNSTIGTGQPHLEVYDTYEEALEVAKTFGYIEPPEADDVFDVSDSDSV
jgi:hypothetical protein